MDLSHQPSKSTDFRSNLESRRGRPRIRIDVAVVGAGHKQRPRGANRLASHITSCVERKDEPPTIIGQPLKLADKLRIYQAQATPIS